MPSSLLLASHREAGRTDLLERRLRRFHPRCRDAVRVLAEGKDGDLPLRQVMSKEPHCLPPRHTAIHALRLMRDGGFRHVPVVEAGMVIGIVSRGDFRGLEQDRLDEETGIWERIR